jgi:hypothetical protein
MMRGKWKTAAGIALICMAGFVFIGNSFAQDLIIYLKEGQSQERMGKDKFECYTWAKGQTGVDPMVAGQAGTPPPQQQQAAYNQNMADYNRAYGACLEAKGYTVR